MTRDQYEAAKKDFLETQREFGGRIEERDFFPSDRPAYRYLTLRVSGDYGDDITLRASELAIVVLRHEGTGLSYGQREFVLYADRELADEERINPPAPRPVPSYAIASRPAS